MELQQFLFGKHLEKNETLLFVAHKHWVELVGVSVKTVLFGFIIPWTTFFFFPAFFWIAVAWSVVVWLWYLYNFADWYFDAWLATDYSVIDVEWKGIFHHLSSRIPYSEVRDISWEIEGFWGTILGYGDATIGMSTGGKVTLPNMKSPKKVEIKLIEARDNFLSLQKMTQSDGLKELLSELVAEHVQSKPKRSTFRRIS
jgi:hypothetical protein